METPSTPGEHGFATLTALVKPFQKFRTAKVNGAFRKIKNKALEV